jgi:hypothetical protein
VDAEIAGLLETVPRECFVVRGAVNAAGREATGRHTVAAGFFEVLGGGRGIGCDAATGLQAFPEAAASARPAFIAGLPE